MSQTGASDCRNICGDKGRGVCNRNAVNLLHRSTPCGLAAVPVGIELSSFFGSFLVTQSHAVGSHLATNHFQSARISRHSTRVPISPRLYSGCGNGLIFRRTLL
jgi:hypothetical protein